MFFFVSSGSGGFRRIRIPFLVLLLFFIAFTVSIIGIGRAAWYIGSYSYARLGLYDKSREHENLITTMTFLEKRLSDLQKQSYELANFEDRSRIRLGLNEISEDVRKAGVGGPPSLEQILNETFDEPEVKKASALERNVAALLRQVSIQDTTFSRFSQHVFSQYDRWAQRPSIWPVRGRITSSYGYRYHPFLRQNVFHDGIDIAGKIWTPIFATADGICKYSGNNGNYGLTVKINHREGTYETIYAHLQKAAVVEGEVVKRGDLIGYLGNTGRSTGPHVHYEVRKFGRAVSPMDFILPLDVVID